MIKFSLGRLGPADLSRWLGPRGGQTRTRKACRRPTAAPGHVTVVRVTVPDSPGPAALSWCSDRDPGCDSDRHRDGHGNLTDLKLVERTPGGLGLQVQVQVQVQVSASARELGASAVIMVRLHWQRGLGAAINPRLAALPTVTVTQASAAVSGAAGARRGGPAPRRRRPAGPECAAPSEVQVRRGRNSGGDVDSGSVTAEASRIATGTSPRGPGRRRRPHWARTRMIE